ncbi:bifunctional aspartate kinase/homoserine dehydrogenase I [Lacinutrix sp.]|uniref:bifunctional aspartate kinase/homoserine dehydrogenase I n=1 Tax=Lacinutrix sp. TaxID=1937692 RepID=UPI0025BFC8B9|nr:bifunctional aspartate kinase/homoserine dehydrogenase I [Lacinutrix sp.]
MQVLKFGGTSVGSSKNINKVISILENYSKNAKVTCVVSAVGGITDKLLKAGNLAKLNDKSYKADYEAIKTKHFEILEALIPNDNNDIKKTLEEKLKDLKNVLEGVFLVSELSPQTSDRLVSYGELLSSFIIAETLKSRNFNAARKNTQQLIVTNSNFNNAEVKFKPTNVNISTYFSEVTQDITVLPGFISKSDQGEITTLGRGGSDYTAAIISAALNVDTLEIWTDVSGMYTANPKLVKQAFPVERISYQEAMELSHFGAKVLYPPTVQPVLDLNIPIHIKNTLKPEDKGTIISSENNNKTSIATGITNINNIALLTLQGNGMIGIPGFSKRLFETLSQEKINIILITQASSEHTICFGILENDAIKAETAINLAFEYEISKHKIDPIIVEMKLSIIALVGDNMKNHQGISGKMFSVLGKNNINIRAIAQGASERNISAVISEKDVKKALNTIHERFFEDNVKQLNVFITGIGNVGEKLIDQIHQQNNYLKKNLKLDVRIVGLANSKKMIFDSEGINLDNWASKFHYADKSSLNGFLDKIKELNLRNSIFVDVTANDAVSKMYEHYLRNSIAVVACSKIACSSTYSNYKLLQDLSLKFNTAFLYETNVGAGLPIINTLNNLVTSGDKVTSIQAVLSGSLNFVFNNFSDRTNFHDIVKRAQFEGYTEPDPRIDLSGIDVARKILILARENGGTMEIESIENDSFLTQANLESDTVDDFYKTLKTEEAHFQKLYADAKAKNCQLKYVAEFKNGKAKVGLREIPEGHSFYNLEGKDNIVMFYTERYPDQPLIVKGAGAGADVTASGLFADIIKIGNK